MHKLLITFCCFWLAIIGASAHWDSAQWESADLEFFNTTHSRNHHADSNVISSIRVTNWGDWSQFESCDENSFVVGFRQKVEKPHADDNTALNAIELICNDARPKRIRGATGSFGTWGDEQVCMNKQGAIGFQLKQQTRQSRGKDNTAANALKLVCEDDSEVVVDNDGNFGEWSQTIKCADNHVICGLRVQIQPPQVSETKDDTSLNNVDFQCCPKKVSREIDLIEKRMQEIVDPNVIIQRSQRPRAIVSEIKSPQVTNFGTFRGWSMCTQGNFVVGFRQKVDSKDSDLTGLNGIELLCSNSRVIFSLVMPWGVWSPQVRCPRPERVIGFRYKQQGPQGTRDDTAANAIALICAGGRTIRATNEGKLGAWSNPIVCPPRSFICGINVQALSNQGRGDDVALDNVMFRCCNL